MISKEFQIIYKNATIITCRAIKVIWNAGFDQLQKKYVYHVVLQDLHVGGKESVKHTTKDRSQLFI